MNFSLISKLIISNGLEDKDKYVDILTAYASQGGLCLLIRHALCSTQNSLAPSSPLMELDMINQPKNNALK